jgi:drug/metabolite transporter (DMT)-like permease
MRSPCNERDTTIFPRNTGQLIKTSVLPSTVSAGRTFAYALLILTTSIWGSLYIVTRIALETVSPVTLLCSRYLFAAPALFAIVRLRGKPCRIDPKDRLTIFLIGALGNFTAICLQVFGTKFAGASVASLINSINPVFIILFAVLFLRERLTMRKFLATAATLIGVAAVLGRAPEVDRAWGIGLSVASVVLWSFSSIIIRRLSGKYDPITITFYTILSAALCSIPFAVFETLLTPHGNTFTLKSLLCLAYLGVICTALPNLFWNKSLSLVEASTCSLFYPIQPLVSAALGIAVLGEKMTAGFWIGGAFIIGGILAAVAGKSGGKPAPK